MMKYDVIVDSWMLCFLKGYVVWFEEMFNKDVVFLLVFLIENLENEDYL